MRIILTDGGRKAAGFEGKAGDCVARAVAVASGQPYADVYRALAAGSGAERVMRGKKRKGATASHGIHTGRVWFKRYMTSLGFRWVATMGIGTGCTVHLRAEELPPGRLVVDVSKHCTAVVDGVVHDTHDPTRGGTRCVYGYWIHEGV